MIISNMKKPIRVKKACLALATGLLLVFLTGCAGSSGNSSNKTSTVSSSMITIAKGAQNKMCNDALTLTILNVERRPISIFSNASVKSNSSTTDASSSNSSTSLASTTDVAIEVDVKILWNKNTYLTSLSNASNKSTSKNAPTSLSDVLMPGTYMYIQGTDSEGAVYKTGDYLVPGKSTSSTSSSPSSSTSSTSNSLALNSKWDYDILDSALPETSVEADGAMLFKVSSTAQDLKLYIITPVSGTDVSDSTAMGKANVYTYSFDLS